MKKQLIATTLLSCFFALPALAGTARVQVNGLVCAFCAQGIKKKFAAEAPVQNVDVNLTTKIVTLDFKPGQNMSDEEISKRIVSAGFNVVKVEREEKK